MKNCSQSPMVLAIFALIALYMYMNTREKLLKKEKYCGACMMK